MSRFDQLVGTNQIHAIGREVMVLDEGMEPDNRLDIFCSLRFRRFLYFSAIFHAALDENRQGGCAQDPMTVIRHLVEPCAIDTAGGEGTDMLEVLHTESQSFHHGQEEFRVGLSQREAAGVFLVDVFGQHAPDGGRRILPMDAGEEDREVPDVHGIFLLKMDLQLLFREAARGKALPSPVMLSVHDTEERFEKSRFRHAGGHRVLPS